MLTTTYALLTLSIEQKKERGFISRLLQYLKHYATKPQEIDPLHLQTQLEELVRFAELRHQHKVEDCLIPAVREATREADGLLAELDSLKRSGGNMLRATRRRLRLAFDQGGAQVKMLCFTLERYCWNVLERLAREERELLPLAQRVISSEQWFAIGSTFLSHDARLLEGRRASAAHAVPVPL